MYYSTIETNDKFVKLPQINQLVRKIKSLSQFIQVIQSLAIHWNVKRT